MKRCERVRLVSLMDRKLSSWVEALGRNSSKQRIFSASKLTGHSPLLFCAQRSPASASASLWKKGISLQALSSALSFICAVSLGSPWMESSLRQTFCGFFSGRKDSSRTSRVLRSGFCRLSDSWVFLGELAVLPRGGFVVREVCPVSRADARVEPDGDASGLEFFEGQLVYGVFFFLDEGHEPVQASEFFEDVFGVGEEDLLVPAVGEARAGAGGELSAEDGLVVDFDGEVPGSEPPGVFPGPVVPETDHGDDVVALQVDFDDGGGPFRVEGRLPHVFFGSFDVDSVVQCVVVRGVCVRGDLVWDDLVAGDVEQVQAVQAHSSQVWSTAGGRPSSRGSRWSACFREAARGRPVSASC